MLCVGNDIVDLDRPGTRNRSKDERFVNRVLTRSEKKSLLSAGDPDTLLWSFWAAKETAYKTMSKKFPKISSAPRRYRVQLPPITRAFGTKIEHAVVKTPEDDVEVKFIVHNTHVHCIGAVKADLKDIFYGRKSMGLTAGFEPSPEQESLFVRKLAQRRLADVIGVTPGDIRIVRSWGKKEIGPPQVYIKGEKASVDISLSHHGRLAAFAFLLNPDSASVLLKGYARRRSYRCNLLPQMAVNTADPIKRVLPKGLF